MHQKEGYTRRQVLRTFGALAAFPTVVPSSVFGRSAPSNRITLAMIGMGRQALYANLIPFLYSQDARVLAVCDVDRWRLDKARQAVDQHYDSDACRAYSDWREVLARDDIDAIMNSTPDHWHVPISLAAVRRGKHVCCEKPLTLSVAEGRVLADAVKKHRVVFRTDSERAGPVSVEGKGQYPAPASGLWNVLLNFQVQYRYADGVVLDYHTAQGAFLRIEGEGGWIHAPWLGGQITASDEAILRTKRKDSDVRLPQRQDKEDFLYGIRNNAPTMSDAEVGHRTCSMCQLGHIAIPLSRKLHWDAEVERFIEDDEANRMLHRSYRAPWGLNIDIP